jgi:hypothetical protein
MTGLVQSIFLCSLRGRIRELKPDNSQARMIVRNDDVDTKREA